MNHFMEPKEQQETRQLYEAPWCEWIELEVENGVLYGDSGQITPGSESYRVGRD